jgi:hypothetical protein
VLTADECVLSRRSDGAAICFFCGAELDVEPLSAHELDEWFD